MMPALHTNTSSGSPLALKAFAKAFTLLRDAKSSCATSTGCVWQPLSLGTVLSACMHSGSLIVSDEHCRRLMQAASYMDATEDLDCFIC